MASKETPGKGAEVRKKTLGNIVALVTTAFGLVAALAWNTAIQTIFTTAFGKQTTIVAMLSYALIVTVIAVVVTTYLSKLAEK
jgi:uncharacterized membrane protein YidH (DUF202 family)